MNKFSINNDPTDTVEEFEELTPSSEFYNSEIDVPEHALKYIGHLQNQNKAMKKAVKELHDEMESTGKLTSYINRLWAIYKL